MSVTLQAILIDKDVYQVGEQLVIQAQLSKPEDERSSIVLESLLKSLSTPFPLSPVQTELTLGPGAAWTITIYDHMIDERFSDDRYVVYVSVTDAEGRISKAHKGFRVSAPLSF